MDTTVIVAVAVDVAAPVIENVYVIVAVGLLLPRRG